MTVTVLAMGIDLSRRAAAVGAGASWKRFAAEATAFPKLSLMTTAAAILICIILGLLAIFQLLLIAGLPLGRFAWGGQHEVLPQRLRIGSAVSILLYAVFALLVLERAQLTSLIPSATFIAVAMWVLTGYFALGVLMNGISRSKPERFLMTPVSFVLAGLCLVVAIG